MRRTLVCLMSGAILSISLVSGTAKASSGPGGVACVTSLWVTPQLGQAQLTFGDFCPLSTGDAQAMADALTQATAMEATLKAQQMSALHNSSVAGPTSALPAGLTTNLSAGRSAAPALSADAAGMSLGDYAALLGKFALVIILLFISLRILKAVMPRLQGGGRSFGGSIVMYSESLGAKDRVVLLDMGPRLVLVGISPTGMRALTTFEDEETIGLLRQRYAPNKSSLASSLRQVKGQGEAQRPVFASAFTAALKSTGVPLFQGRKEIGAPVIDGLQDGRPSHLPRLDNALDRIRDIRQTRSGPR